MLWLTSRPGRCANVMADEPAGSLRPNNGDHNATRIGYRDAGSALRLHPGVRTGWRDGQPDPRYRRDLAAWHGTWFARPPGRNPHGRHGAHVARTQWNPHGRHGAWHNGDDRERHDMLA